MGSPSAKRVASLSSGDCEFLRGSDRLQWESDVWEMYQRTYRNIGTHVPRSVLTTKYPTWLICTVRGRAIFFALFKETPFGRKSALSGFDGSAEGKRIAKDRLRTMYRTPGYFAEVSGKPALIALAAGAPSICNAFVDDIIEREIEPADGDALWYTRQLGNLGRFKKILVGRPKGVPTTTHKRPVCPIGHPRDIGLDVKPPYPNIERVGAEDDLDGHYACLAWDEWLDD